MTTQRATFSSLNPAEWAFFLDVDGTLLAIQTDFEQVRAGNSLKKMLHTLADRTGGAVALISGRSIAKLDDIFAPLTFPAAGLHGTERRLADDRIVATVEPATLEPARRRIQRDIKELTGVRLEDKQRALALHFREAPEQAARVSALAVAALDALPEGFELQTGKCVIEIKSRSADKGRALREFLDHPPFAGRRPVYVGDDDTDEHAFAVVAACGGLGIRVGGTLEHSQATQLLDDVPAVHHWLRSLVQDQQ